MPDSELGMVSTVVDKADGVLILMEHSVQQATRQKIKQWLGRGRGLINRWSPRDFKGSGVMGMTLSWWTHDVMHLSKPTETRQHQDRARMSTVDLS